MVTRGSGELSRLSSKYFVPTATSVVSCWQLNWLMDLFGVDSANSTDKVSYFTANQGPYPR